MENRLEHKSCICSPYLSYLSVRVVHTDMYFIDIFKQGQEST